MAATKKFKLELPEYTEDRDTLVRIVQDSAAVAAGGTLYLGIVALRQAEVTYEPNQKGDGTYGWKGVRQAAAKYEISAGELSKITKVVSAYMPEVIQAEVSEVREIVLGFTAEWKTIGRAYDALRIKEKADQLAEAGVEEGSVAASAMSVPSAVWNLQAAMTTVIHKAVKEGWNLDDVQEVIHTVLVGHYGAAVDGLVDAVA